MVPNPERTGYEFAGWDQELPATMPAYDMVIKANWTPHTYIIRFDANGASGTMADQAMTYGQTKQLNANTYTMPGYAFVGWAVDSTGDPVYADKAAVSNLTPENGDVFTLYARWKPVLTISFETNGGTTISPIHVLCDEYLTKPATPYKEGYSFVGWYTDSTLQNEFNFENTKIQSSYTLYAKWQINQYTITFTDPEGTFEDVVITDDYGTSIPSTSIPTLPTKTGYTVTWNEEIPSTIPSNDITITVVYTINQYTLKFVLNNGEDDILITQDYNSIVNIPNDPEKTGFTFAGWNTTIPNKMPAENMTITAIWKYSISFTSGNSGWNDYIVVNFTSQSGRESRTLYNGEVVDDVIEGTVDSIIFYSRPSGGNYSNTYRVRIYNYDDSNYTSSSRIYRNSNTTLDIQYEGNINIISRNG